MAETKLPPGTNPLDPAEIERMRAIAAETAERIKPPDCLVEPSDLSDSATVAGFRCRPMSAGMLALLEMVKSPLFGVEAEAEITLPDSIVLIFLLLSDMSEEELVCLAEAGYAKLRRTALTWSFRIDMQTMKNIQDAMPAILERLQNTMEMYSCGESEDDKKK